VKTNISAVLQLETSLMKFRNDLAIGGNVSAQTNITSQTQVPHLSSAATSRRRWPVLEGLSPLLLASGHGLIACNSARTDAAPLAKPSSAQAADSGARSAQVSGRANLNSKNTGQVSVRVTSHDKKELAYSFVAPLLGVLWRKLRSRGGNEFDL
jgi:Translocase of chloroplast 159/132, membrane anchor domain